MCLGNKKNKLLKKTLLFYTGVVISNDKIYYLIT